MPSFHENPANLGLDLANYNYARMRVASTDDPVMHGFMSRLDEINAIADAPPGSSGASQRRMGTQRVFG